MNKYPNINKYYNRTPKGFLLFFLILYIVSGIGSFALSIFSPEIPLVSKISSLVWTIVIAGVLYYFYNGQITLKSARMGKHLKKYYGLEGDALVTTIDSIENELNKPLYADASNKRKYNAFFVTENWLVGTDGVMLMRANACKKSDIQKIEKNVLTRYRKGITYHYYILQVTDNNNYVYQFYLRSQENVDMAYDFLMNE